MKKWIRIRIPYSYSTALEGGVTGKNGLLLLCDIKRKNEPSLFSFSILCDMTRKHAVFNLIRRPILTHEVAVSKTPSSPLYSAKPPRPNGLTCCIDIVWGRSEEHENRFRITVRQQTAEG